MLLNRISTSVVAMFTVGGIVSILQFLPTSTPMQVVAQTPPVNRPRSNPPGQPGGLFKELNLSPQQIQRIKNIRGQSKEQIVQKIRNLQQTQIQIVNMMAGNASREQIRNMYNQANSIRQQLADAEFDNILAIREVLTPTQRKKFVELMYKRRR